MSDSAGVHAPAVQMACLLCQSVSSFLMRREHSFQQPSRSPPRNSQPAVPCHPCHPVIPCPCAAATRIHIAPSRSSTLQVTQSWNQIRTRLMIYPSSLSAQPYQVRRSSSMSTRNWSRRWRHCSSRRSRSLLRKWPSKHARNQFTTSRIRPATCSRQSARSCS